ncbi:MAG: DUF1643 domain-containing protein [Synechococcus sp.]|nr:DUF1643 domain-containing protein [Synechococcus sp.]
MLQPIGDVAFSPCGHYRWWLERRWAPQRPRLLFIGLNPSRADGRRNDPTLRRLLGFADRWGFGALEVLNLFSRISPSPAVLRRTGDPVGARTDEWICNRLAAQPGATLWLGWGNQGRWRGRDGQVLAMLHQLAAGPRRLAALGLTASGQPRHPLYRRGDAPLLRLTWCTSQGLEHPEDTAAPLIAASPCLPSPAAMPSIST